MRTASHIISTVFVPFLMPTYSVALLFIYTNFGLIFSGHYLQILLPVFLFSFAVPTFAIFLMHKMKIISDFSISKRRERLLPYIFTIISYSFMIFYYFRMGMPKWFLLLMAASILVMIIALVITLWWKISAHMFGVGGLLGGVMSVSYYVAHTNPYILFIILFVIAGMIGTARLILRRHTIYQVIAGFLLGYITTYICIALSVR